MLTCVQADVYQLNADPNRNRQSHVVITRHWAFLPPSQLYITLHDGLTNVFCHKQLCSCFKRLAYNGRMWVVATLSVHNMFSRKSESLKQVGIFLKNHAVILMSSICLPFLCACHSDTFENVCVLNFSASCLAQQEPRRQWRATWDVQNLFCLKQRISPCSCFQQGSPIKCTQEPKQKSRHAFKISNSYSIVSFHESGLIFSDTGDLWRMKVHAEIDAVNL